MHMSIGWKERRRERCSVWKRPWFRRSLEVVTRLLIAQKEQPTCMCVCDNDTVKINKTLYSRVELLRILFFFVSSSSF